MDKQQRIDAFKAIYNALPGSKGERAKMIADQCGYKLSYIRMLCMKNPRSAMSERGLALLSKLGV